jgi:hypothetical protein
MQCDVTRVRLASEPPVDRIVGAVQLARARAKYHGYTKGATASLMDIHWLLEETMQKRAGERTLDAEGGMLVRRYLEMEVPYHLRQLREFVEALEEVGLDVDGLPQTLEKLESERDRLFNWVQAGPHEGEGDEARSKGIEELASFKEQLDSEGEELDRRAYDFLIEFIQNNKLSKELATALLEGEEASHL